MDTIKIKSALISVYYKDQLEPLVEYLREQGATIYSTGGTQTFLEGLGAQVTAVEDLTQYPAIFGGRVKTLHPKIFGGILHRRGAASDQQEVGTYQIPTIDLVVVDLYPFEETVKSGAPEADVIEKIDIGGISLIRAAAKNFQDVLVVSSREQYTEVVELLRQQGGTTLADRKRFAAKAFDISSHYDTHIFNYLNGGAEQAFKQSLRQATPLRYGENPHQKGVFYGQLDELFDVLHGKQLSYNNLVDVDAAVALIDEFHDEPAVAILKHTNACGVAVAPSLHQAYLTALACDPVSAFGGVIIANKPIDKATAEELHKLFFEVLIAPDFAADALEVLQAKKNRILLRRKPLELPTKQFKTLLNGVIEQDKDLATETEADFRVVTQRATTPEQNKALVFAAKVCKHTKSNTIVFATADRLISSGVGQTSRIDALEQAIEKAQHFGFELKGAVMASDAFFPFPDCVEIASKVGIEAVVQPGGSVKDQDSIDFCNAHNMAMVFTGVRHFKH
ncbi:MAG: bifunctional phosphoribosylaminoimidazolecarboxamide formyltransferase/IMP cyclohydrolase [Adhaeribacter sp.]